MTKRQPLTLWIAGLFTIYAAWSSISGWLLSAFGSLNPTGYLLMAVPGTTFVVAWLLHSRSTFAPPSQSSPFEGENVFNPAKLGFLCIATLVLSGAVLHAPTNHDGLTYRLPRLLYWLQEGRWHWIPTPDFRMNIAGALSEWMAAPILLATGGDRLLFLLNFIPFLLLPGLFLVAATGLGIPAHTARWWMWTAPLAYGLVLQAGSIGNDAVGAYFALASLAFVAHARNGPAFLCFLMAAINLALMTGLKVTTLPLVLPLGAYWLLEAWRILSLKRTLAVGAAAIPIAIPCSFIPIAVACWVQTGAWTGNPSKRLAIEVTHPLAGIIANGADFVQGLIYPPAIPGVERIDALLEAAVTKTPLYSWIQSHYPGHDLLFHHELPTEEAAGIGLGLSILLGLWFIRGFRGKWGEIPSSSKPGFIFALCTIIATVAFFAKVGGDNTPRLILPFTPILILSFLILVPTPKVPPSPAWTWIAVVFLIPTLIMNPNRPLVPTGILRHVPIVPESVLDRVKTVHAAYSRRNDLLADLRDEIPIGEPVEFGGSGDRPPYSLFRPFGSRKVYELGPLPNSGAEWVIGTTEGIEMRTGMTIATWEEQGYTRLHDVQIIDKVSAGSELWCVWRRIR